ncbi:hypothetical protein IU500_31550 [Nocardia terpenica]|nr:hypothetical protein [Nocardia terpenica]MBF6066316.1 hypothetical protein [Nocardia terpenica]MBF6108554.1 hypothetical protein [Nocardia terpenica]MBF6116100.1 hypothetical protein [Nocardia terpenica]MBF6123779.1 hypothetical protein [Nocardia terpenica]MBF6157074.1 hypothetical protein [Nocardia terpenica]
MPDFTVTLCVILGFLGCALLLRVLANPGTQTRTRVPGRSRRTSRAMIDE